MTGVFLKQTSNENANLENFSQKEVTFYQKEEKIIRQPLATSVHIVVLAEKISSDMVHVPNAE